MEEEEEEPHDDPLLPSWSLPSFSKNHSSSPKSRESRGECQNNDFDLNQFLEELNATLNIEPVELSSRNNSGNKKKKRKVQDNNNNQESSPSGLLAPALDESGDPLLQSQNATNKYSVRTLLANIRDHQDEHEAEMEEEPDEECDLVLNSALFGKDENSSDQHGARQLNVFSRWPVQKELPRVKPPPTTCLDCLPAELVDCETWEHFVCSGHLLELINAIRSPPEALLRWLFHTVALEINSEHVLHAAGKALLASAKRKAAEETWVPSGRDFEAVMSWYGADSINRSKTDIWIQEDTEEDMDTSFSPTNNLYLLLKYMSRAIQYRPNAYGREELKDILWWVSVLLQDRLVGSTCYAPLRACLISILAHPIFSNDDGGIGLFEEALGAGNEGHLPNQVLLLSYLPISSSSVAKRFREHFAMLFLANFFGVESPRCDTLGLLSQLVALVGTTEIKKDTDYSHLACMVDLIDFTTSAMRGAILRSEQGQNLTRALRMLNGRIREVQGFNLSITRVKDKLVILATKLEQTKRLRDVEGPFSSSIPGTIRGWLTK